MNCKTSLLAFLLLISVGISAQTPALNIPEFSFLKQDKSSFTNKSLPSGKLLFFVFFDVECDHCQHAIEYINQHYKEFIKTAIYLITLDSPEKTSSFIFKHGRNLLNKKSITILQDAHNEFILKFKPRKYPSIFLYSSKKELIIYDDNEQNLSKVLEKIKGLKI